MPGYLPTKILEITSNLSNPRIPNRFEYIGIR